MRLYYALHLKLRALSHYFRDVLACPAMVENDGGLTPFIQKEKSR